MKISIVFTLTLLIAVAAKADTYFEILYKQFTSAHDALVDTEFDEIGAKSGRACTEVFSYAPDKDVTAFLRKFVITEPGRGPLLPGKKTTKVLFNENSEPDPRDTADVVVTTFAKREVQTTYQGLYTIRVRKTAPYLFFLRYAPGTLNVTSMGYCFPPKND